MNVVTFGSGVQLPDKNSLSPEDHHPHNEKKKWSEAVDLHSFLVSLRRIGTITLEMSGLTAIETCVNRVLTFRVSSLTATTETHLVLILLLVV